MDRRSLIAASAGLAASAAAGEALADGRQDGGVPAILNIAGVGLPVIEGGRLRNYVFVSLRLHLGGGHTPQSLRPKEPWFRDALVRAAHRTPFLVPGDWTRLDERALSSALIAASARISGRGSIVRVEVLNQAPRRRSGMPTG